MNSEFDIRTLYPQKFIQYDSLCLVMNRTAEIDLDIIWDITTVCGWDCSFCCVDAVQVEQRGDGAILRKNNLQDEVELPVSSEQTAYEAGSEYLKKEGI